MFNKGGLFVYPQPCPSRTYPIGQFAPWAAFKHHQPGLRIGNLSLVIGTKLGDSGVVLRLQRDDLSRGISPKCAVRGAQGQLIRLFVIRHGYFKAGVFVALNGVMLVNGSGERNSPLLLCGDYVHDTRQLGSGHHRASGIEHRQDARVVDYELLCFKSDLITASIFATAFNEDLDRQLPLNGGSVACQVVEMFTWQTVQVGSRVGHCVHLSLSIFLLFRAHFGHSLVK